MSEIQSVESEKKTGDFISKSKKSTEEKPVKEKPLKITPSLDFLISEVKKKAIEKEVKKSLTPKPAKVKEKTKKELEKEAKELLNNCKGKTKDGKECTRKESENCNGFCKQHFNIEKEKAVTVELIEKHMKP